MKKKTAKNSLPCARAGVTTLLGLGAATGAHGIVTVSPTVGGGLRPPAESFADTFWDVDNDGTNDFKLLNQHYVGASFSFGGAHITDQNGGRVMGATSYGYLDFGYHPLANLPLSQAVSGGATGYGFATQPRSAALTNSGNLTLTANSQGWSLNTPGYIGFKFTNVSGTHYGWASITIDGNPVGQGFIITEAYYESDPDTAINVGDTAPIPEAETAALGLAGLALGAAGLRRWRKKSKA